MNQFKFIATILSISAFCGVSQAGTISTKIKKTTKVAEVAETNLAPVFIGLFINQDLPPNKYQKQSIYIHQNDSFDDSFDSSFDRSFGSSSDGSFGKSLSQSHYKNSQSFRKPASTLPQLKSQIFLWLNPNL